MALAVIVVHIAPVLCCPRSEQGAGVRQLQASAQKFAHSASSVAELPNMARAGAVAAGEVMSCVKLVVRG